MLGLIYIYICMYVCVYRDLLTAPTLRYVMVYYLMHRALLSVYIGLF